MKLNADEIYNHFKSSNALKYDEDYHCRLLVKVMIDKDKGDYVHYCVEAKIAETTFFLWVKRYELFRNLYYFCRMVSKAAWYEEGKEIKSREYQIGTINYDFEHWKLMGWTKFGISKNARIRISLNPEENPAQHYASILQQAADGDFTAAEFKQLMEAVNVGLNVHQVFELQKQIDELKSDLAIVSTNKDGNNTISNKRTP